MIAHLFVLAFCALALSWAARVLIHAAVDGHHRGRARIHAGTSWQPRIPRQESRP